MTTHSVTPVFWSIVLSAFLLGAAAHSHSVVQSFYILRDCTSFLLFSVSTVRFRWCSKAGGKAAAKRTNMVYRHLGTISVPVEGWTAEVSKQLTKPVKASKRL